MLGWLWEIYEIYTFHVMWQDHVIYPDDVYDLGLKILLIVICWVVMYCINNYIQIKMV